MRLRPQQIGKLNNGPKHKPNPGAGVQKMSFQQEEKTVFFMKNFLNIIPP
jgi:hypothetical protein